ncbi:MAG: TPM domain-containing protein [Sphingobacteriales bacterium]|nr:MAG: TPM domain-containing protein [Sphingobacteriales bacterium]
MKRLLTFVFFLFTVAAMAQQDVIPNPPNPPRLVNDNIHLLSETQREELERKLVAYDDSTSNQILIYTTDNIGDYNIDDYAVELGRKWGVGGKQFNNGVVFIVYRSPDNTRRKVFIATGYGLEGSIPDITAKQILDNEVIPFLKGQDYYRAFDNGVDALIKAAAGKYKAPQGYRNRGDGRSGRGILALVILFIVILVIINNRRGGGGGMMSRRGYGSIIWPLIWGSGGGGGWGGGGSSGGGGFGGFGGGGFGGGGAGGDW